MPKQRDVVAYLDTNAFAFAFNNNCRRQSDRIATQNTSLKFNEIDLFTRFCCCFFYTGATVAKLLSTISVLQNISMSKGILMVGCEKLWRISSRLLIKSKTTHNRVGQDERPEMYIDAANEFWLAWGKIRNYYNEKLYR